jgi:ATP-dependent Lon protease
LNFLLTYQGCLFITTANTLYNIPRPLLDRMETITIPGYTEDEKMEISKGHLIPKQLKEHGLSPSGVTFTDDALMKVIRNYTREAGVRNLERQIANICRKIARAVVEGEKKTIDVDIDMVEKFLGVATLSLWYFGKTRLNRCGYRSCLD